MLAEVAKRTHRAPSEVIGIDCPFCAFCFDEALVTRAAIRDQRAIEQERQRRLMEESATNGIRT